MTKHWFINILACSTTSIYFKRKIRKKAFPFFPPARSLQEIETEKVKHWWRVGDGVEVVTSAKNKSSEKVVQIKKEGEIGTVEMTGCKKDQRHAEATRCDLNSNEPRRKKTEWRDRRMQVVWLSHLVTTDIERRERHSSGNPSIETSSAVVLPYDKV